MWAEELSAYDFGPGHPLAPVRVELTVALIDAVGLGRDRLAGDPVDLDDLLRIHHPDYVEAVQRASRDPSIRADWAHGLGPGDNPVFPGMHEAALAVCGASVRAARAVWEGTYDHAFAPAGGLHHAMPDRAAGFCIYNDPALAIDWLLRHGAERVCYLDVDVHHGDGVQAIFYDDPRVLTISLHESGRYLFPGTGDVEETGGPNAPCSAVNIPFLPGTTGEVWLWAFDAVVDPLIRAFRPDVLVTQLGCDTHVTDPLAHLALTVDDLREAARRVHRLAHEAAGGRWVALGGGGYQHVRVVPRAWTIWFAEMADATLPERVPEVWRRYAAERTGQPAPERFHDDPVPVDPGLAAHLRGAAERAVARLRETVLPHHGAH